MFIMVGISGSGKSTAAAKIVSNFRAQESDATVISSDAIRGELTGDESNQTRNSDVFKLAHQRLDAHLAAGENVIFDATNLSREERKPVVAIGRKHGAKLVAVVMCTPLTVSIERNRARTRVVPTPAIWKQQGRFYPPTTEEVDEIHNVGLDVEWPHWKPVKKS